MKTRIEIKEVEREDLVNFLSGLSSDDYFRVNLDSFYRKVREEKLTFPEDCKCIEEQLAHFLLRGGKIWITDYAAEGIEDRYNDKAVMSSGGIIHYPLTTLDVAIGVERALNGVFKHNNDENNIDWARKSAYNLVYEPENFDADNVTALIQVILFNEIIYA